MPLGDQSPQVGAAGTKFLNFSHATFCSKKPPQSQFRRVVCRLGGVLQAADTPPPTGWSDRPPRAVTVHPADHSSVLPMYADTSQDGQLHGPPHRPDHSMSHSMHDTPWTGCPVRQLPRRWWCAPSLSLRYSLCVAKAIASPFELETRDVCIVSIVSTAPYLRVWPLREQCIYLRDQSKSTLGPGSPSLRLAVRPLCRSTGAASLCAVRCELRLRRQGGGCLAYQFPNREQKCSVSPSQLQCQIHQTVAGYCREDKDWCTFRPVTSKRGAFFRRSQTQDFWFESTASPRKCQSEKLPCRAR